MNKHYGTECSVSHTSKLLLSCLNTSCLQHSWAYPIHTKENRPLLSTHNKRFYRWKAPNQRRMSYPPTISMTPTLETNTVPGIIDYTLQGLQNSAHFPESPHQLKTKLDTYEAKLEAGDLHVTDTTLTRHLGRLGSANHCGTPNIKCTIFSEPPSQGNH